MKFPAIIPFSVPAALLFRFFSWFRVLLALVLLLSAVPVSQAAWLTPVNQVGPASLAAGGNRSSDAAQERPGAGAVMLIPCDADRETDCRGYFRSMMRYVRTFTVSYRIREIRRVGEIEWLLLDFSGAMQCGDLIRIFMDDLRPAGAVMETGACGGRRCEKLFNLNHRLMLACLLPPVTSDP